MPLDWIDVTNLSFNTLLLLERVQLSWFPGWIPEAELAIALQGNPTVEWYMRHKCPEISQWLASVLSAKYPVDAPSQELIRQAELKILRTINDLVVYVVDPTIYDAQPFMGWDPDELLEIAEFSEKTVIDIGSGTGKLAMIAAEKSAAVFAVEPVNNLRLYLKQKARDQGYYNIYPVDGLITDLPFPDKFADITMGGHIFGDSPETSFREMKRVTKTGGMIILCPGSSLSEVTAHEYLVTQGFNWSTFEEPTAGTKRKYWKKL